MEKVNTFIIPIIRSDLIGRCLETLYAHTADNFYVFVIDQSADGINMSLRDKYKNLMIIRTPRTNVHTKGNLGFAMATNLGIRLATTPYMTLCNDDVEFIHKDWWQGVMDTFDLVETQTPDRPAAIVNPASVKLPDWSVGRPAGEDHYILPYKDRFTDADWDLLVNEEHYVNQYLTIRPGSVIDGVNLYCSVAHRRRFLEAGLLDEVYYPGGAEDYDTCCRLSTVGYRCVGTTKSWVFHHWSKSFKTIQDAEQVKKLIDDNLRFGNHNQIWGDRFDIWGIKCRRCDERLRALPNSLVASCPGHPDETFDIPPQHTMSL
jgi:GT2 family glycosyltransferase